MAIEQINYPVTGSVGTYKNIFPSQKPLNIDFTRKDGEIDTIISGVDGNVRLSTVEDFENVEVGQFVVWQSDGYELNTARVISIIDAKTIEVDVSFDSANATNGFINYHRNWYLEFRYVRPDSTSGNQNAIQILDDFSQIPSALNGDVKANIALPKDLISPNFTINAGIQSNLFVEYKIQYRQSYNGNRSNAWISPALDVPILLVHASKNIDSIGFTDQNNTKRYVRGYSLNYMILYSNVNDQGNNQFKVSVTQYNISKQIITTDEIEVINNLNGVYNLAIDTSGFDEDTCFIEFSSQLVTNNSQYDTTQYNLSQYA